jgi:hypothetical protein
MKPLRRLLAATFLLLGALGAAHAHKPSDSYLTLAVDGARLEGRWDIALRDLDFAIGLDADGDGRITWGELKARHEAVAAYALARLQVQADGAPCPLAVTRHQVDRHTDGAYAVLVLQLACPARAAAPKRLTLAYTLFADLDPQHRGLLNLRDGAGTRTAVLGPQAPTQHFELGATRRWSAFTDYLREGVWHIWIGFDHILFLLALLLPSVLVWRPAGRDWMPASRLRDGALEVAKIVTAFTLAHSITLSLAALGVVALPSRLVESAIAASVVLAALNNVVPVFHGRRWAVAFGFGLVHGFGFASVLADLGLPRDALALALVGFNLGVEAGQLAIVAAFLPLAFALRHTAFYRRAVMVGGSALVAGVAGAWLVERAFDLKLLPF